MSTPETAITIIPVELERAVALTPLSKEKALIVCQVFAPYYTQATELLTESKDIAVNAPIAAKLMRLRLKSVRCAAELTRVDQNEEAGQWTKSVNAINKTLKEKIEVEEERLAKIEQAELIAEEERRLWLKAKRDAEFAPYGPPFIDFSLLKESDWQQMLAGAKLAHEAKIAADKKAEEERIAKEKADAEAEAERIAEIQRHNVLREERETALSAFNWLPGRDTDLAVLSEAEFVAYLGKVKTNFDAEVERLAKERAERERLKAENDRLAKEKAEADALREKKEIAMGEIEGIRQQALIAQMGRAGVRKGGTIECIKETLAETELWPIDPAKFGELTETAHSVKTNVLGFITNLLTEAEKAKRVADEQAEKDRLAKIEQDKKDEEARVERARLQAIADEERKAREKMEAEIAAKKKAETARIRANIAAAKKAAAAPDRDKLKALALSLRGIQWPEMATEEGSMLMDEARVRADGLFAWLESESEKVGVENDATENNSLFAGAGVSV